MECTASTVSMIPTRADSNGQAETHAGLSELFGIRGTVLRRRYQLQLVRL